MKTASVLVPLALITALGCGRETSSPPAPSSSATSPDLIRQTVSEIRSRPMLVVQIRDAAQPSPDESTLRKTFEEKVEQEHIGSVTDMTIGAGYVSYTIQVDETVKAIPRIRALLQQGGMAERSTISVRSRQ